MARSETRRIVREPTDPAEDTKGGTVAVPRIATLDGFAEAATGSSAVALAELLPETLVRVETENSTYRILVCNPLSRAVLVEGGRFFPQPTPARLSGATFGGSLLRLGWIVLGMRMEIHCAEGPVVTSSVQRIVITRFDSGAAWRASAQTAAVAE